jgi:hypothetical protein
MTRKCIVGIAVGFLACLPLSAVEVRVVRFATLPPNFSAPPCPIFVQWASQTLFHNSTDAIQTVQFLGVSNGNPRPNPRPLTVPPHQTVTVEGTSPLDWEPAEPTILWINRLEVPSGVILANRVQSGVFRPDHAETPCTGNSTTYAGLPLPIFSTLIPVSTPQYFLGTDVGSQTGFQVNDARLNIGVYNGGLVGATAVVKVYCGHTGPGQPDANALLQTAQVQIPANSVVQSTVLASTQAAQCPNPGASFWYATVTVDQPSFAYAIGLANGTLPTFPGVVALTYTAN